MATFLIIFIIIPLLGFIISLLVSDKNESLIASIAFITMGAEFFTSIVFTVFWLLGNHPNLSQEIITLYQSTNYVFFIELYFDKITMAYLIVGAFVSFLVTIYSRYYLHREKGYKRFFNTVLFFSVGYTITILAGNFETLFMGWEMLGISSFLLIAFYRDRYLPVKNAVKVFTIYRIGDIGIILAMWMSHHLWHENITFLKLNNYTLVHEHLQSHSWMGIMISLMLLVSASAKSAQLPFSSWLPRAMEGPTPSSAIFYGSLSVHIGVFLLLRTFTFWEHQTLVRIIIAIIGLITALVATGIARVQSSVKSQIAYASIAQIGLIFIEVASGFEKLALWHFAGNAFLRTYQLLVSPSVVSYLIREQFFNFSPKIKSIETLLPTKIQHTLYVLCLKEWNLDSMGYNYFWNPLKKIGGKFRFINIRRLLWFFIPSYILGFLCLSFKELFPAQVQTTFSIFFALLGLAMVMKAFTERNFIHTSWFLIIMNHFWNALAISFNEHFSLSHVVIYLSGVIIFGIVGDLSLNHIKKLAKNIDLNRFQGYSYDHPKTAFIFLLACLGLSGFPISPTFIGEDLIFSHIHENQLGLAIIVSLSFIVDGLAIIRLYARVFLGPPVKVFHEIAYRSS